MPQFDEIDPQAFAEARRIFGQRQCRFVVIGGDAAIDAEGERHERVAEQARGHVNERQDADQPPAAPGAAVMSLVPEAPLDHAAPAGAMEKAGIGMGVDEAFPFRLVARLERADDERRRGAWRGALSER